MCRHARFASRGGRIKLQEKPFQTLALLLEHTGEVVTREQLRQRLWPADTFVQFDDNLNTAIKRVREALGDSAENPCYVETVPRRGYRFLPPVETAAAPPVRNRALPAALAAAGLLAAAALLVVVGRMLPAGSAGVPRPAGEAMPGKTMLAVLPFRNLSGDTFQEYISDGMTEELIAHLGRLNPASLRVIARSSVMRYKNAPEDVEKVGRDLGVAYVLEGSVRRSGNQFGVTAQLVETHSRTNIWAETYERSAAGLLATESDVARGIAEALAIRLLPEQELSLARASALAHDGAARAYLSLADYRFLPPEEGYRMARQRVEIALRLDQSIPQSHELAAEILDKSQPDAAGAGEAYRKAISLNPGDAYAQRT